MIGQLLAKVIGTQNEREIKRLRPRVAEINALEPVIQALTDEQLRAKTFVSESLNCGLERIDLDNPRPKPFDFSFVLGTDDLREQLANHANGES